mgnify:FL=1|jgi:hypothetical protein
MVEFHKANDSDFFKNWPEYWPTKENFVNPHKATKKHYLAFKDLISQNPSETEIELFLKENKEMLALITFLFSTGHHASWVYPKQHLRIATNNIGGKIPDYIIAGANSDGVSWYVLELKGANKKVFIKNNKRVHLSSETNKGICQLIEYIDISTRSQSYLRDEINLKGYREPKGILLIGTDEESENQQVRDFKAAWNRMNNQIQIYTYNRLLRVIEHKVNRT